MQLHNLAFKLVKNRSLGFFGFVLLVICVNLYMPIGIYLGGDWSFPASLTQANKLFYPYLWSDSLNFGTSALANVTSLPFNTLVLVLASLQIPPDYYPKLFFMTVLPCLFFTQYKLLRYIGLSDFSAIIGGVIYLCSPCLFNYSIMGWHSVVIAMALMPISILYFYKSIAENKHIYALLATVFWSFCVYQAQAIFWFPILFLIIVCRFFLVGELKRALHMFAITFIGFLALNAYWILPILTFNDENISNNQILISSISTGADAVFTPLSAAKLWGGLFNYQYETVFQNGFSWGPWLLLLIVLSAFLQPEKRYRALATSLGIGAFVIPLALLYFKENRELLLLVPWSGAARQLSRFSVISSIAYATLAAIWFQKISSSSLYKYLIGVPTLAMLTVSIAYPIYSGGLTNENGEVVGKDFRLRVKQFNQDYFDLEKKLSKVKLVTQSLYFPSDASLSFKDDPQFNGMFQEGIDLFSLHSPIPGKLIVNDRFSPISDYLSVIRGAENKICASSFSNSNIIVIRKNTTSDEIDLLVDILNHGIPEQKFSKIFEGDNVLAFAKYNPRPIIYAATASSIETTDEGIVKWKPCSRSAETAINTMIFKDQNIDKEDVLRAFSGAAGEIGYLEYKKLSPVKYKVVIRQGSGTIPLVFDKTFSPGWRLYSTSVPKKDSLSNDVIETFGRLSSINYLERKVYGIELDNSRTQEEFISPPFLKSIQNNNLRENSFFNIKRKTLLKEGNHIKTNGYSNGWLLDADTLCKFRKANDCVLNDNGTYDIALTIEFWPQQFFYIGCLISLLSLFVILFFYLRKPTLNN